MLGAARGRSARGEASTHEPARSSIAGVFRRRALSPSDAEIAAAAAAGARNAASCSCSSGALASSSSSSAAGNCRPRVGLIDPFFFSMPSTSAQPARTSGSSRHLPGTAVVPRARSPWRNRCSASSPAPVGGHRRRHRARPQPHPRRHLLASTSRSINSVPRVVLAPIFIMLVRPRPHVQGGARRSSWCSSSCSPTPSKAFARPIAT